MTSRVYVIWAEATASEAVTVTSYVDDDPPPPEQGEAGADELTGAAATVEKSAVFESVSVQPPAARAIADVASGAGAASAPSKSAAAP